MAFKADTSAERFAAYSEREKAKKFRQIKFFVHDDDRNKLRRFVNRMNEKRKDNDLPTTN